MKTLALLCFTVLVSTASAAEVTVCWTKSPCPDRTGYRVYWGTASNTYTDFVDVGDVSQAVIGGLDYGVEYFFSVTAWGPNGESPHANEVSIIKNPPPPNDTEPPVVQVIAPTNGSVVRRKSQVVIEASATDNVGVKMVELLVNGSVQCTVATAPWRCTWKVPNGRSRTFDIGARAWDAAGNSAVSTTVRVTSQ
jgi:hypothetical protein